ncbi:MAG: immunoglobulin domain-containing protein, partial [Verrucomicrobiota bacterium]
MKTALPRIPALLLSVFLQLSPLLRIASTEATALASPVFAVLRWLAGATAVAGSFHSVSGATGLTITPGTAGTTGVAFGARASIVSSQHGAAQSYSVTASTLAPGLVMSKQGVFSGIPTTTGSFVTQITGWANANTSGDHFTTSATFTIAPPVYVAPTISLQPVGLTTTEGGPATFTVAASGTPAPSFQWTFAGQAIAGATGSQYQIVSTVLGNQGNYAVVVSNAGGTVTSATATLVVNPLPPVYVAPTISLQPVGLTT